MPNRHQCNLILMTARSRAARRCSDSRFDLTYSTHLLTSVRPPYRPLQRHFIKRPTGRPAPARANNIDAARRDAHVMTHSLTRRLDSTYYNSPKRKRKKQDRPSMSSLSPRTSEQAARPLLSSKLGSGKPSFSFLSTSNLLRDAARLSQTRWRLWRI